MKMGTRRSRAGAAWGALLWLLVFASTAEATPKEVSAKEQLDLAIRLYSQDRLDEAVAAIRAGQALNDRPEFLYALGQVERRRGHCLPAIEYYERYLATRPSAASEAAARTQIERCRAEAPLATNPESRAQLHFQAGEAEYRLGRYADAVLEWKSGYELAPRPLFLLDLAQAYHRLGDPQRALAMYERFLDTIPEGDAKRAEVEQVISELHVEISKQSDRSDIVVDFAPQIGTGKNDRRRRWWIAPVVIGVAAAAAIGIGLGVHYGRSTNRLDCNAPGVIGCIPAP